MELNKRNDSDSLVMQIYAFKRSELRNTPIYIHGIIDKTLDLIESSLPDGIQILREIDKNCGPVMCFPTQVHQIMINLCSNAIYAMRGKCGIITVALHRTETGTDESGAETQPFLRLAVIDDGHGMNQEIMQKIYDPYFTTKPCGEGTGLGLAMVHGIIRDLGGNITFFSRPGDGTVFNIYLPMEPMEAL